MSAVEDRGPLDRLVDGARSPAALGAGVAGVLVLCLLVLQALCGQLPLYATWSSDPLFARETRIALALSLFVGWLLFALGHARRDARASLLALRASLPDDDETFAARLAAIGRVPRHAALRAGMLGLATSLALPLVVDRTLWAVLWPVTPRPEVFFHRVVSPVVGWLVARTAHAMWTDAGRLSWAACDLRSVDLLDLSGLAPFARHGLRLALLSIGFCAIAAIVVTDRGLTEVVLGALLPATIVFATAALVRPVFGARRRVRLEKAHELALVGSRLASRLGPGRAAPGLADLLAWEARIAAVHEWPFDASTLSRFGLALLVPLGSWLGGAVVERLLAAALG